MTARRSTIRSLAALLAALALVSGACSDDSSDDATAADEAETSAPASAEPADATGGDTAEPGSAGDAPPCTADAVEDVFYGAFADVDASVAVPEEPTCVDGWALVAGADVEPDPTEVPFRDHGWLLLEAGDDDWALVAQGSIVMACDPAPAEVATDLGCP